MSRFFYRGVAHPGDGPHRIHPGTRVVNDAVRAHVVRTADPTAIRDDLLTQVEFGEVTGISPRTIRYNISHCRRRTRNDSDGVKPWKRSTITAAMVSPAPIRSE